MSEQFLRLNPYNFDTQEEFDQFHYEEDCKFIMKTYAIVPQKFKLAEECAELIRAIVRCDDVNFNEELADVCVLIDQFMLSYPDFEKEIKGIKAQKVARQIERITNAKY